MTPELQDLLAAVKVEHLPDEGGRCSACMYARHPCDVYMLCEMMERFNDALAFGRKSASDATYDRESELAAMAQKVRDLEAELGKVDEP